MTQAQALDILKTGGNVFLTGEPGSGKTYVLNKYTAWLEACNVPVAVTASTGIAATHIGGMTIHSWSWIGIRDTLSPYDLDQIASKEKVVKRINKARVLVIDEISMLDGRVLEMVDSVCKTIRKSTEAFGGLQVVFVGDFFQLPPIAGRGDVARFAFESRSWEEARPLVCYINEQYRQEDEMLLGLLNAIRRSDIDESHYTLLEEQKDIAYDDIEPTRLYTHNADVDEMNAGKLKELSGNSKNFKMETHGNKQLVAGLVKSCLSPELLELKEEAMVMCTKNNFDVGFVNGTLGRVVRFDFEDGLPVIETTEGREIKMTPMSWEVRDNDKVLAEVTQVPLRLAWAITVHKSQGMSLDAVEIDLTRAFVYGQGYVALSRVRTLAGLKVNGLNANALTVDPKVISWDEKFKAESESAEETFSEMDETGIEEMHQQFVRASGGKIPENPEAVIAEQKSKGGYKRLQKESTTDATMKLLKQKMNVKDMAKERGIAMSTIWTHLEKLAEIKQIGREDLRHLVSIIPSEWEVIFKVISVCFEKQEDEKLKPVFEALDEKYDYETIRLVRLIKDINK